MKGKIIRDIKTLFGQEDYCYKATGVGSFWNYNSVEYDGNSDRNTNLSVKKYLDKIKPYLRDIIVDLPKSGMRKVQLTIAINFIS